MSTYEDPHALALLLVQQYLQEQGYNTGVQHMHVLHDDRSPNRALIAMEHRQMSNNNHVCLRTALFHITTHISSPVICKQPEACKRMFTEYLRHGCARHGKTSHVIHVPLVCVLHLCFGPVNVLHPPPPCIITPITSPGGIRA